MLILLAMAAQVAAGWPWVGNAQPPAHTVERERPTIVRGLWGGRPVVVRLAEAMVPDCRTAGWLHGAAPDRQGRCTRLVELSISVAGKPMQLSSSGYADLGGINDVVLRTTPARLILYMRGPDGPDYYGATLEFDRNDIVRRQLDLADGGREVTTYRHAPDTDL